MVDSFLVMDRTLGVINRVGGGTGRLGIILEIILSLISILAEAAAVVFKVAVLLGSSKYVSGRAGNLTLVDAVGVMAIEGFTRAG
ncbi:hypothetical protein Dimus_014855 [Dionaea muscipula]